MMKRLIVGLLMCVSLSAAAPVKSGYELGDIVADFRLKNVDGKMISLSDFKDAKGIMVIFDCNTCPYSKAYNSRIIDLNNKYVTKGFPVITINPNDPGQSSGDSFEHMVSLAKEKGYSFPYLVDETQDVTRAFGATNTPHVFLLQRNGNQLKLVYIGAIDDNARDAAAIKRKYVEEAVDALLLNKPVPVLHTKALGCSIKWKAA